MPTLSEQLAALAAHFALRREAILGTWRAAVTADPLLVTGAALPRAQLHDHIPALLEDFEARLTTQQVAERRQAREEQKADAAAHGLHRWQQGFNLEEVTRELGRLNECVVQELDSFASNRAEVAPGTMAEARRRWAASFSVAVTASTSQYFKLQQMEAAGHVSDLEQALVSLRELEARRAELWQQAAHDLRGNLGVVTTATAGLTSVQVSNDGRAAFLGLLERNVRSLHRLLEDVTGLARLQGGQEHLRVAPIDATPLLREICESLQPLAQERKLYLRVDGPESCRVEGDAVKLRRIVQNLVLNATRYTLQGGVTVTWGLNDVADGDRWFVQVQDTGPGFLAGSGSELVAALGVATGHAKTLDADALSGEVTHVAVQPLEPARTQGPDRRVPPLPGEGIGLSIVKRLCELLDATIELDSRMGEGTTFRVLIPRQYDAR